MFSKTFMAVIALGIACIYAGTAEARKRGEFTTEISPACEQTIMQLTDAAKHGCCATADGWQAKEASWSVEGQHYTVLIEGETYIVPDDAVITVPNCAGIPIVWYYRDQGDKGGLTDGPIIIRCFWPGTMSMLNEAPHEGALFLEVQYT
jgi:hypothetical protein